MSVFSVSKSVRSKSKSMLAVVATSAVVASSLIFQAAPAFAAAGTVANGIVTHDLNAIGVTPAALAQELAGAGVTVSNVHFTGDNTQGGTIDITDPNVVSFNHGIILSSGDVANAVGPNKSDSITGYLGGPEDTDLTALIANTATVNPMTYDATTLSFDFVPNTNKIYFTYTFASDEYLEWVNLFNDVFAFYVNGTNCATVPSQGGNVPVSIDTINSQVNPSLFRDNAFSNPPANPLNIEYDGLSVEMICSADVNPGVTNHMKLAIADTSDGVLDTAVMIKAQSLSTTPAESCNNGLDDNNDSKIDMDDNICQTTTTAAPVGQSGVGGQTTAPLPAAPVALTPIPYSGAPAFTGNEGTPILLDPAAFGWTLAAGTMSSTWEVTGINGNNATCQISPSGAQALNPDGTTKLVYAVCPNDGEYVAHVWGWECAGGPTSCPGKSSDDYDVDFFVHNAPPTSNITEPSTSGQADVTAGSAVTLAALVADPGDDEVTCTVTWGDGTSSPAVYDQATQSCSAENTYAAPASTGVGIAAVTKVIATITATDSQGSTSASAIVLNIGAGSSGPGSTPQTLSFNTSLPDTGFYGDAIAVDVSSDSGLTPDITVSGGCSISGTTISMTSGVYNCDVFVDQAGDSTYAAAPQLSATIYAAPMPIYVVADPQTKVWGEADPTLSYYILAGGPLVGGDTFSGELSRTAGEDLGSYAIDQGTLDLGPNYSISFGGDWLEITGYSPIITKDLVGKTVAAGAPLVLNASADASPSASIKWQIKTGDATYADIATATGSSFVVPTSGADDGAIYRAVFDNGLGSVATSEVAVNVVSVSSLSHASRAVGQSLTISGTSLSGISAIRFIGATTTNFVVNSPTSITVVVPSQAKSGIVTVMQGALIASSADAVTITKAAPPVPAAKVTNIWPRAAAAGSTVTITGTHLSGTTAVTFGGSVASNFVVVSSTRILATVPQGASTGSIALTNPNGNASTSEFSVRSGVMVPKVSSVRLVSTTAYSSATLLLSGLHIGSATNIKLNGIDLVFTPVKADQVLIVVPIVGAKISPVINKVVVSNGVATSQNTKKLKVLSWQ